MGRLVPLEPTADLRFAVDHLRDSDIYRVRFFDENDDEYVALDPNGVLGFKLMIYPAYDYAHAEGFLALLTEQFGYFDGEGTLVRS